MILCTCALYHHSILKWFITITVLHGPVPRYCYNAGHVLHWSRQIAVGLEYIHNKRILHRDIKASKYTYSFSLFLLFPLSPLSPLSPHSLFPSPPLFFLSPILSLFLSHSFISLLLSKL